MDELTRDAEVREALITLQQYLSDAIAPLIVADSVEVLLRRPPELAAAQIQAWIDGQYRVGRSLSAADYIFHALKKIHLVGQFRLVPADLLTPYVGRLSEILLEGCPEEQREALRSNLTRLGMEEVSIDSPVEILHRPGGAAPSAGASGEAAAVTEELVRDHRRLALLLDRLEKETRGSAAPPSDRGRELLPQLISTAAGSFRTGAEFREYLQLLQNQGLEAGTDRVFRELGRSLPSWVVPIRAGATAADAAVPAPAEAMRRIVTMEEDAVESGKRLHEMVQAAIDRFNEGALPQAVTMLGLAERILSQKRVDPGVVISIRETARESLDGSRLRELAENPEAHPLLREVLNFFPALTPSGLLSELQTEEKRERRRLLLALVEAHGAAGRAAAAERLEVAVAEAKVEEEFFARNLVYLLRRIPRPADVPPEAEIDRVIRLSEPGHPAFLLKEAIAYLAQARHDRAEGALLARLKDLEGMALRGDEAIYDSKDLVPLLDRVVSALARSGTRESARAVVSHGLKRQPQLGDAAARLSDLSGQDLSGDRDLVERLLKAIRAEIPRKVLGFVLQKGGSRLLPLVQAVSGTPDPAVRRELQEIAERFPEEDFGRAAARALSAAAAPAPATPAAPPASLSGDLELFGLPNLLQNLAQSEVSGTLMLLGRQGDTVGTLWLRRGRLAKCRVGLLEGDEAVYQLFERPLPGTFTFMSQPEQADGGSDRSGGREVIPLLLEGMRRHDEFQRARALVPDGASLKPTGTKPTRLPEEPDQSLLRAVWARAIAGSTPSACEAEIPTDSFRIRRLLAHWVEQGALAAQ